MDGPYGGSNRQQRETRMAEQPQPTQSTATGATLAQGRAQAEDAAASALEQRALRTLWRAIEHSPAATIITDTDGRIAYVNPKFSELTGYARTDVLGRSMDFLRSDATSDDVYRELWQTISAGKEWRGRLCNKRKDASTYWADMLIAPVRDASGAVSHYTAVQTPLAAEGQDADLAAAGEESFRALACTLGLGIVIERNGVPLYANRAFAKIFGYSGSEDITALTSLDALYAADEVERVRRYRRARTGQIPAPTHFECRGVKKDGSPIWIDVDVKPITWEGQPASVMTAADITLRKIYENRLQHQASVDPVTDLPNRSLAMDRLAAGIASGRRRFRKVGVLFIDVDHFKQVNDTFGHAMGDRFLRQFGERLKLFVREEDTVARLGGDEFVVILPDLRATADAEGVARKIIEAMSAPFILDAQEAFVGASIGITISPEDGLEADTLLRNADVAMYQAKTHGRNTLRFFTPRLNARALHRHRAEARLRLAMEREDLRVLYQPIVSLQSGTVVGAEALLRLDDPELGLVEAEHFVRIAEETGQIAPIGAWIATMACRDAAAWRRAGLGVLHVSVNVCGRQFRGGELTDAITRGLRDNALPADSLQLEFTEALLMNELPQIVEAVRLLEAAGVRLAVDDFGTGYSSLSYLCKFPLATVKIDGSLIRRMIASPVQASVVEAIITMAHRLKLRVVAEGVETAEQLAFLRHRQCDEAQGYLFSEPLNAAGIRDFIAARSTQPAGADA